MDITLLLQMVGIAMLAAIIYTIIGVAPGTDETATIAPVILVLVLSGLEPILVLTFFMSAIVSSKLTDSIPVALAGIPGGVMATPQVEHALILKKHGLTDVTIRKMASGSVIGTLVSVPVSLLFAHALIPFADVIKEYGSSLFFAGAIILALISKNRWVALVSILPFALLIEGLRHLYWDTGVVPAGTNVFISFFLGITIGPMIVTLFGLLNKEKRDRLERFGKKDIYFKQEKIDGIKANPFTILTKKEIGFSSLSSAIGSIAFILSPVGLTTFLGEVFTSRIKDPVKKASLAIASMDALANATYISGVLIPLIALGIPLSPTAMGPGNPLFNAPPVFTIDHNLHHILSNGDFISATLVGAIVALAITYFLTIKYSRQICIFVFKRIPHEAMLGLFFSLVLLLAFMDGGWMNVAGVFLVGFVAGTLHRTGVNYGVQFMTLYSAPWIISLLANL
ncbi:tripartite tricarboxylate transporter permease [Sporosarcina pasteurii]|uniref:Tripartite tricarboxylate transporter TctA family n=1 Tax=Sporosarcina pasteurii TaxID=1474 RepID=A0A380CFA1_SPOPA|nr:tripartite tricarboxylate transporter permease [Sporosarcina pasteurii]MDS9473198.1 tripartite tricarboxylate transporter permease [Sporosarcina pasteurii]QBQ06931.1 tripartite tricarboxylate transporter TctA family protein [Sporosarcina pasteurii]SUJ18749.1 Tripartite tricarboxylate transporter TctA family [Sporosarcina pasteurii]